MSQFKFLSFEKTMSSPDVLTGEKITYLIFELEEPIEKVTGSTRIPNPDGEGYASPTLTDVMQVRCNVELMLKDDEKEKPEFTWELDAKGELTGKGSYKGDLILDISRKDDVWLTDTKFRDFGMQQRSKGVRERYQRFSK